MEPSKSKGVMEKLFTSVRFARFFGNIISSNLLAVGPWSVPLTQFQWTILLHVLAGTIAPYLGLTKLGQATTREMILRR